MKPYPLRCSRTLPSLRHPQWPRAARVIARATVANLVDPPFNVVISNVPGPQFPIYSVGTRLVAIYPVAAINDGVGLNITVQSYNGALDFGLVACRELIPDPWDLMDYIHGSLDELGEAAKKAASLAETKQEIEI